MLFCSSCSYFGEEQNTYFQLRDIFFMEMDA